MLGPNAPYTLWRAAAGDFDGNGWPDVIGIELFGPVHVWLNLGGGSFVHSTVQTTGRWQDLALGDLDGDGDLDVAFASDLDERVGVLLGAGDGTFVATPTVPYYGASNVEIGAPAGRTHNVVFVRGSLAEEVGVFAVGPDGALSLTGRWTTRGGMIGGDSDPPLRAATRRRSWPPLPRSPP